MIKTLDLDERLIAGVTKIDPSGDINKGIAKLLFLKEHRDLVKYELMSRNFERKYESDFASFKKKAVKSDLGYKEEQDFFDWDMAVTGAADIKEKIGYLERLIK